MKTKAISTQELLNCRNNPEILVADIRPSVAYNGWKLKDENRGGHIPGAINLELIWVNDLSKNALSLFLISKGITPQKTIIVYGYEIDNCRQMAKILMEIGVIRVLVYELWQQEWANDPNLPLEHLPGYEKLVYAEWLNKQIQERPSRDSSLFEVSWRGFREYEAGHISGAKHLDLYSFESPLSHNICEDDELLKKIQSYGITHNSSIVLYGRDMMPATRAACILMYAGVEDVRILNGGLKSWLEAGFTVEPGVQHPAYVVDFGVDKPINPGYIIGIEAVKQLLLEKTGLLVSVQSWNEFNGETSGYEYIESKGHIPGAIWGYSGSDPYHLQDYRNLDDTMRSYIEIASNWQKISITPDKRVVFYCGTGWRASEVFFYAYLMGWRNISVFDGGWFEWCQY
jgi:thiosulfate/3-mercaptopyruvate sulfurtransferase